MVLISISMNYSANFTHFPLFFQLEFFSQNSSMRWDQAMIKISGFICSNTLFEYQGVKIPKLTFISFYDFVKSFLRIIKICWVMMGLVNRVTCDPLKGTHVEKFEKKIWNLFKNSIYILNKVLWISTFYVTEHIQRALRNITNRSNAEPTILYASRVLKSP